jgi:hypothetical protein
VEYKRDLLASFEVSFDLVGAIGVLGGVVWCCWHTRRTRLTTKDTLERLPKMRADLVTLKGMSKEHIHTIFSKTMYSFWNTYSREMMDPHLWLLHYLDCKFDIRGTNPHSRTLVRLFCKVCKEDLRF